MFNIIYAYNTLGQMVPMKFFSPSAACESFLTMGQGKINIIDDDNNFHHAIDSSKGIFIYDEEQQAFLNYNPFTSESDVKDFFRRHGNDPAIIIDARNQMSLEDLISQQIEEIKSEYNER